MNIPRVSSSQLLAQRLDTLLGTKLAQQLASSTRPTTQEFIPQAARTPPLESSPQAPERPPAPLPEHTARQAPSQQARQAPLNLNLARGLPTLQAADLPGTPSAPISLGNTAQLLVQLLRHFPSPLPAVSQPQPLLPASPQAPGQALNPLPGQTPGAPAAPLPAVPGILQFSSPVAAHLFQSLSHAIRQSGLFYESHLAQFAAGRYPRASLQTEPQARLAADGNALPEERQADAARVSRAEADLQNSASAQTRAAQAPQQQGLLPPDAALTVRQQLETLALQTVHWRGEAWPQAEMQWTISRDGRQEDAQGEQQAQQWSSQLTLTLPRLGQIHVRLHLAGEAISIRMAAPQADATLNAQAQTLRQQMRAAGLTLRQLDIAAAFDDDRPQPAANAENQP